MSIPCVVFVILLLRTICGQLMDMRSKDPPVYQASAVCMGNKTLHFITLSENHCHVTDNLENMRKLVCEKNSMCLSSAECFQQYFEYCLKVKFRHSQARTITHVIVPNHYKAHLPRIYRNVFHRALNCTFEHGNHFYVKYYINFIFGGDSIRENTITVKPTTELVTCTELSKDFQEPTSAPVTSTTETITSTEERNNRTPNETIAKVSRPESSEGGSTNFYLYIGVGVAVFVVVVILQTTCIIIYKRKVASTRRTLDVILTSRDEKIKDKSVRYSTGPELKRIVKVKQSNNDNLYASVESIADDTEGPFKENIPGKSTGRTNHTEQLRPREIQSAKPKEPRSTNPPMSTRPKQPLPHEMQPSKLEATTRVPQMPQNLSFRHPRPIGPSNIQSTSPTVRQPLSPGIHRPANHVSFPPLPPTPESLNSSDEEWTYETLPPMEAYLH